MATISEELDYRLLERELDRTKSHAFLGQTAAFFGPLMCSMEFIWDENIPTAATNGLKLWWNPHWFLSLEPETRKTVLMHELWHNASMHLLRADSRDPDDWNRACDYEINGPLDDAGYSFKGTKPLLDHQYDRMAAEQIYDIIHQQPKQCAPWGPGPNGEEPTGDMIPLTQGEKQQAVANVMKAAHSARINGQPGAIPGNVQQTITKFLAPIIPWEQYVFQWLTELLDEDYSWARPNRRFQDIYLPSRFTDDGRLAHLIIYEDVSGSVSDHDVLRFNSEFKYLKETFNPEKITLVQFDTTIQQERVFLDTDPFDEVVIVGRGGTSLVPVKEHIETHRPTAAVIFSDLECAPMQPLTVDIPILWIVVQNSSAKVPFGKKIHIRS